MIWKIQSPAKCLANILIKCIIKIYYLSFVSTSGLSYSRSSAYLLRIRCFPRYKAKILLILGFNRNPMLPGYKTICGLNLFRNCCPNLCAFPRIILNLQMIALKLICTEFGIFVLAGRLIF